LDWHDVAALVQARLPSLGSGRDRTLSEATARPSRLPNGSRLTRVEFRRSSSSSWLDRRAAFAPSVLLERTAGRQVAIDVGRPWIVRQVTHGVDETPQLGQVQTVSCRCADRGSRRSRSRLSALTSSRLAPDSSTGQQESEPAVAALEPGSQERTRFGVFCVSARCDRAEETVASAPGPAAKYRTSSARRGAVAERDRPEAVDLDRRPGCDPQLGPCKPTSHHAACTR